jgi:hypothetical protein
MNELVGGEIEGHGEGPELADPFGGKPSFSISRLCPSLWARKQHTYIDTNNVAKLMRQPPNESFAIPFISLILPLSFKDERRKRKGKGDDG